MSPDEYVTELAARREKRLNMPDCVCGHPATHHDAGECWTNPDGTESQENTCACDWYQPGEGA